MCGSCTCVKPADGDNQVGKDENDSKERVLSSDLSDQDIGSFFVSAARCKKNEAVPGFEDVNKILNAADG